MGTCILGPPSIRGEVLSADFPIESRYGLGARPAGIGGLLIASE